MIAHTPGPWIYEVHDDGDEAGFSLESPSLGERNFTGGDYRRFLTGTLYSHAPGDIHANAALIATAPDLLAICMTLGQFVMRVGESTNRHSPEAARLYAELRALIAKVEAP